MRYAALDLPLAILVLAATPLTTQLTAEVGSPQAQQPGKANAEQPEMVLTGCLRSGAADTSVAGPSGRLYTLEVTETVATAPPGSPTPAATGVATKVTYSLSAPESLGLAKHADQAVELTGRLQAPSAPANQSKVASPAGAAPPKPGGAHRTFQVSRLKAVPSRKCS
jgi:hypothetical protein